MVAIKNRILHLFIFIFSTCWLTSSGTGAEIFPDYYRFLESIASDPTEKQISALKTYVQHHPEFYRPYLQLLNIMLYADEVSEAKDYFQESAAFPERENHCLWMLAKISAIQDSTVSAQNLFRRAILHDTPPLKLLNDYAGFLHENAARFDGVAEIRSLNLERSLENPALAFLYRRRMAFQKAIDALSQIDTNNPTLLHVMGYCHTKIGQHAQAESYFQRGLRLAQAQGDLRLQVYHLVSLGLLARQRNQPGEEAEKLKQAFALATRMHDLSMLHLVHASLGTLYLSQKKYAEGLQAYRDAIRISAALGLARATAQQYRGKAQALFALGEFNDVLAALEQNERYAQKSNDIGEIYSHHLERGKFYNHLNLTSLAEHEYERAYELGKTPALRHKRHVGATRYADLLVEQQKYQQARDQYSEFLDTPDMPPVYRAYWRWKIAESYYLQEKYDIAHRMFLQAQNLLEQLHHNAYIEYLFASTRLQLAAIEVHRGQFAKAKAIYQEEVIARVAEDKPDRAVDLNTGLGNAYYGLNQLSQAISHYKAAIAVIEKGRKELHVEQFRIGYFSKHVAPYQALIRCYLDQYEDSGQAAALDTLFYYMEMSRARTLRDLRFAEVGQKLTQRRESPQQRSYRLAKKRLESIQREIRLDPSKYDALYPRYEAARYQLISARLRLLEQSEQEFRPFVVPLDSVLVDLRQSGMGLLFYHISEQAAFALAANDREVDVIRLSITPDSLTTLIDELLLPFSRPPESSIDAIPFHADRAHDLYEILLRPVERQFRLDERLMIVPDRALRRLPFDLLLVKPPHKELYFPTDSTRYAGDFLLKRYTFLYSPTTLLTQRAEKVAKSRPSILVLANPAHPNPQFTFHPDDAFRANWRFAPNLYYADSEGDSIRAVYPGTTVLKREQATTAAFEQLASRHHILHFATHAFVDTVFDAFSGLVLAAKEAATDDGLLMGYEIAEHQLDCELVTLSACASGRGKLVRGEGILGLPRQFLRAGAHRVLMTLWQVSDQFTLSLMPKFYAAFLQRGMNKPAALRQARMGMLNKSRVDMTGTRLYYQHPFFWASFALYGTPDASPDETEATSWPMLVFAGILLAMGLALVYYARKKSGSPTDSPPL